VADDCSNLLNPKRDKRQRFCCAVCGNRQWMHEHKGKFREYQHKYYLKNKPLRHKPRSEMNAHGRAISMARLEGHVCGVCGAKAQRSIKLVQLHHPDNNIPDHCCYCGLRMCIECRSGIGRCKVCAKNQLNEQHTHWARVGLAYVEPSEPT